MPAVRAMSRDTSAMTKWCLRRTMKKTTAVLATSPNPVSSPDNAPERPMRASIRSSPDVSMLPTASAAENTTPMMVSVARRARSSSAQTNGAPKNSMATAPKRGLTCSARAIPMPGRATWDKASPARAIRLMTAKHPTRAAAAEMTAGSTMASKSMRMRRDPVGVQVLKQFRREHTRRTKGALPCVSQAEDVGGIGVHDGQLVRDQQDGQSSLTPQALEQSIEPFLSWSVDAGGRLVQQ